MADIYYYIMTVVEYAKITLVLQHMEVSLVVDKSMLIDADYPSRANYSYPMYYANREP